MIASLLGLGLLLGFWHLVGWLGLRALAVCSGRLDLPESGPMLSVLTGLVLSSGAAMWVAIFRPVDASVFPVLAGLAVIGTMLDARRWAGAWLAWGRRLDWRTVLAMIALIAALGCAGGLAPGEVRNFDTGLYHAQAVRWLREWGLVPGLGNLHPRLAFNSSWFALAALCEAGPLFERVHHVLNLVPVIVAGWLAMQALRFRPGQTPAAGPLMGLGAMALPTVYRADFSSLSPDLWAQTALWVLLIASFSRLEMGRHPVPGMLPEARRLEFLLVLLVCYLPTVKLNVAPGAAIGLGVLAAWSRDARTLWLAIVLGAWVTLPYLIGNYLLSGYLVFPMAAIDWFSPDWKIPREETVLMAQTIKGWAIQPGPNALQQSTVSIRDWIGPWFASNLLPWRGTMWMLAATPILQMTALVVAFRRGREEALRLLVLVAGTLAGLIWWLLAAPDVRFGYGWIVAAAAVPVAYLAACGLSRLAARCAITAVAIAFTVSIAWFAQATVKEWPHRARRMVRAELAPFPEVAMNRIPTASGLVIQVPAASNHQAWNAELPGAPNARPDLIARGASLGDGFRSAKATGP